VVEVVDDNGLSGWGELGGGGESAEAAVKALLPYLKGHDPLQFEQLRWKIMNPTASLYNNRLQLHAAIEMACLDLAGKQLGMRACDFLGGALREQVDFAAYLFYRYEHNGRGGETMPEDMVRHALELKQRHGFRVHKLKGALCPRPRYRRHGSAGRRPARRPAAAGPERHLVGGGKPACRSRHRPSAE
jgi:glucarate dehydratase